MQRTDIDDIRARADAATPGPWRWAGNTRSQDIRLVTRDRGRVFVMGFRRWGMHLAQPEFQVMRDGSGYMIPASDLPIYEVCPDATTADDRRVYRQDIIGIRNPDAEFIASARQDIDDLLDYIDVLEADYGDALESEREVS